MEYGIFMDVQKIESTVSAFMKRFKVDRNEAIEGVADVFGVNPQDLKNILYEAEIAGLINTDTD